MEHSKNFLPSVSTSGVSDVAGLHTSIVYRVSYAPVQASQRLSSKESAYNVGAEGDMGSISESGRSPGGGHSNPLQYWCLENTMDRGAWQATVHGVAKSQTRMK